MPLDRRELLGTFGVASASTLLWALGCGGSPRPPRRAPQVSDEVHTWLDDAVARLAAVYPSVHALAVSRRRTVAATDVAGAGFGRERHDAIVLTVRDRDGHTRERVSSELTADGVAAAATALGASNRRARVERGPAPAVPAEAPPLDDADLQRRVAALQGDLNPSSRIIYRAALIDHDDAIVWSVAPGRAQLQRLVRVRQSATRAAWNGARPGLGEATRAWSGSLDDAAALTPADVEAAAAASLELMTPGVFDDGARTVVLDPSVAAALIDAIALIAPPPAAALLTLVDDPTAPGAYGGFAFDDTGALAAPLPLIDAGRVTPFPGRGRRAGHTAPLQPATSHLQVVPGALPIAALYTDGLVLEGSLGGFLLPGPTGPLVRLPCARARQLRAGNTTGRVYADVELVAPLAQLLSSIDAIASAPTSIARASLELPLWRSISTPALRTRGFVRTARPPQSI